MSFHILLHKLWSPECSSVCYIYSGLCSSPPLVPSLGYFQPQKMRINIDHQICYCFRQTSDISYFFFISHVFMEVNICLIPVCYKCNLCIIGLKDYLHTVCRFLQCLHHPFSHRYKQQAYTV